MNKYPSTTEQFDRDLQREMGERIREARKGEKISVVKLARLIGVSSRTWYRIEAGDGRVDSIELYRIGRCLSVSVDYLLFGEQAAVNSYLDPDGVFSRLDYKETKQIEAMAELNFPNKAGGHSSLSWMMVHSFGANPEPVCK